jgi:hypothetical protein
LVRITVKPPHRSRAGTRGYRFVRQIRELVVVAAALGFLVIASVGHAGPSIPGGALRVDVSADAVSRPVPPGFIGLSIEYRSAPYYFGGDPSQTNPLFVSLLRQLTPGQSPVLRFGGDTSDWTWWPVAGMSRPPGVKFSLGPGWAQITRAAAVALNARLIFGINFEADSATVARTESDQLLAGIGRPYVAGFELGNEPEVYGALGWYENAAGAGVPGRSAAYGFHAYLGDYARISAALPRSVPLVGPASGAPQWLVGLGRYLRANPRVGLVTFHRYPLHRCFTPRTSPDFPTVANLLAPVASSGPADSLQHAVAVAHAHGLAFRSDELNSVSCGGARGVSDTFASALWAVDTLFNMARVGVDGVNIHTFRNAIYAPFAFRHAKGRWTAQVRPLYYGLLLFARAAPPGARLLRTTVPAADGLRVWATRAPDGRVRVVLLNESARRWLTTALRGPAAASGAIVERLRAPRLTARHGVTLGGQAFASATASLAGARHRLVLQPVQGRFVVRLPPASATLVTLNGG